MKQKILYILLLITVWIGGMNVVWGQPGYNLKSVSDEYYADVDVLDDNLSNNRITLAKATVINNTTFTSQFTIGDNLNGKSGEGIELKIGSGKRTNTIKYSVLNPSYNINFQLNGLELSMHSTSKMDIKITPSTGTAKNVELPDLIKAISISLSSAEINSSQSISISLESGSTWIGPWAYLRSVKFTYTLSYYELDITALDAAISTANNALSSISDGTMQTYLNTAITNANTFKGECAFPNSYWNGSPVGKTPADVTATAEKLNAITNYLLTRTEANTFDKKKIPNAVYTLLHQFDEYNPNDFDTGTINGAANDIRTAIAMANATTVAYQQALTTIAEAEGRTDHNDAAALAADVANARTQLEQATSVDGINAALANIKSFDAITFSEQNEIEEGSTLAHPASATSGKAITYTSADNTIIAIDGQTLKALKAGKVTIKATTKTGNGYYGYTTTKEYTVNPTAIVLEPGKECSIVPNATYPEISLKRSFEANTHYTLTLPFNSNISDIGGDYAAQLELVTLNQIDGYTLYFKEIPGGNMVANQPYIVFSENGFNGEIKWSNITIAETIVASEVSTDRTQGWTMQGNYTPGVSMVGKWGIAGGKMCLGAEGATINAYTAYFEPPTAAGARVRMAVLGEDGGVTYIDDIRATEDEREEMVYRLDGVRTEGLGKGVNIVRMKDGSVRKVIK